MAFKLAAIFAVKDAFKKAKPILLEPIMKVENIDAGRISGRHHGRLESPPRQDRQHRSEGQPHDRSRGSAAGGNVRLRDGDSFAFQRPFELLDGAVAFEQVPQQLVAAVLDQKETK